MNNEKLNTINLKLGEYLKGGIPANQFFCLHSKMNNEDREVLNILKNRYSSGVAFTSLEFNPANNTLEKKVLDNSSVLSKDIVYSSSQHIEEKQPIDEVRLKLGKTVAKILEENEELINNAIRNAVRYKLGYFEIDLLIDRCVLIHKDGLQYFRVDGEDLLIIYRGDSLLDRPQIIKKYKE